MLKNVIVFDAETTGLSYFSDRKDNHFETNIKKIEQLFNEVVHESDENVHYEQLTLF